MDRTFRPDTNIFLELIERLRAGKPAALATILEAEGSTPQVPGASALFTVDGLVCGTVGGGSVEGRAGRFARAALAKKRSMVYAFDLARVVSEDADGICGGRLKILIDADPGRNARAFEDLLRAARARRAGVLATVFDAQTLKDAAPIRRIWIPRTRRPAGLRQAGLAGWESEIAEVFRRGLPALLRRRSRFYFFEPHLPLPRLIIAGAGHVGRAVARLGKFLNFEVIVLDDRAEFAHAGRFPEADRIIVGPIDAALRTFRVDADTYIVIVTRGHSQDERTLRTCVKRRAGYIGMIGSARKVGLLRTRFLRRGWATAAEWNRVHAPIGLPIGSKTVEEIAVSIAAELVLVRRKTKLGVPE